MHISELETPAVVVDLDAMERNLARLASYTAAHGLQLRPHTKTHKIPAIAKMQVESGCSGITVAKAGEAEVMAHAGLDNILIAYPIFGAAKLGRVAELAREKRITVAVDSEVTARALSEAAVHAGSTIHLLVEVDVGMRRCGVARPEGALELARAMAKLPGVRFAGITFYPGHIWLAPHEQAPAIQAVAELVGATIGLLKEHGFECGIVSGGSTPSAYNSHLLPLLTEIRPGTYVFNDRNTWGVGACELADCALRVMVTVVSNAVPGRAIIDGGSKTFSMDRWFSGTREGHGLIAEDPQVLFETMSEEHGHLDTSKAERGPAVGDRLSVIPNHVCACVNLHDRIWYHRGGVVQGSWEVAGRGKVQ